MLWRAPWLRGRESMLMLAVWDVMCVSLLYVCTYRIRIGTWEMLGNNMFFIPIAWVSCSYLLGRYSPSENSERYGLFSDLLKGAAIGFGLSTLLILHAWINGIDDAGTRFRGFLIPLFGALSVLSSCARLAIFRRASMSAEKYTIICSRDERVAVCSLNEFKKTSYEVEFIEEDRISEIFLGGQERQSHMVIGEEILNKNRFRHRYLLLRSKGVRILGLTDWCERYLHQVPPELVQFNWLAIDEGFAVQPGRFGWRVKRLGDIVLATTLLAATLPLQILACILIRVEDGGPVLYRQIRTGLYGESFVIYKLRSMCVNSETNGAVWSKRRDSRVTRLGAVLRKFRIDELPQLINVISGQLSLIGPRPERPELEKELRGELNNYDVRYWIKPGLTGWAQVSYPYGASIEDSRQKLSYDLFYVKNAGVLMDMLIALKTARMLFFGRGSLPAEESIEKNVFK